MDPRIEVWCDFANDYVPARLHNGKYFCSCCGSTEHGPEPIN